MTEGQVLKRSSFAVVKAMQGPITGAFMDNRRRVKIISIE